MRRAATPAIPPSMYRHFAIITVALTTALAMFASGERNEAETRLAPPAPAAAQPAAFASQSPAGSAAAPAGWDDDSGFDTGFGAPMERIFGGGDSSFIPDFETLGAPGYTPEYLASLSEQERELLLRGLQENGMLSPETHGERSAAIRAASSRRAGGSSVEE